MEVVDVAMVAREGDRAAVGGAGAVDVDIATVTLASSFSRMTLPPRLTALLPLAPSLPPRPRNVNAIAIVPAAAAAQVTGANTGGNDGEEGDDPLCHKTQMVLLLDSQKQNDDFISTTAMISMLSHVEGIKDDILKMVKESSSSGWHESVKDVLETSVNRFTGGNQRPGKCHRARKLTEI